MSEQNEHRPETVESGRSSDDSPTLMPLLFVGLGMIVVAMVILLALT